MARRYPPLFISPSGDSCIIYNPCQLSTAEMYLHRVADMLGILLIHATHYDIIMRFLCVHVQ